MSESKFLEGFTDCALTLPHTGQVVRCAVPTLKKSAELIRLFESTKVDDAKVADLMDQFPVAVGLTDAAFDGLTPAEFLAVVTGFFSARRDLQPEPPGSALAPSSTGPS